MGAGFAVFVPAEDAERAVAVARKAGRRRLGRGQRRGRPAPAPDRAARHRIRRRRTRRSPLVHGGGIGAPPRIDRDGPPRMEARPTGSGRERSSPNRCDQCRGQARHLSAACTRRHRLANRRTAAALSPPAPSAPRSFGVLTSLARDEQQPPSRFARPLLLVTSSWRSRDVAPRRATSSCRRTEPATATTCRRTCRRFPAGRIWRAGRAAACARGIEPKRRAKRRRAAVRPTRRAVARARRRLSRAR